MTPGRTILRTGLPALFAALFVLLFAGCGSPDSLQAVRERGVLRVGTTGDYRPMSFRDPATGKYEGFDAALAEELARDLGVRLEYVPTTWPTLMRDTLERRFDLALCGITITPDRQQQALMSEGYLDNGKTVLCRAEDAKKYTSLAAVNRPEVRVMENPGGLNEKFARANLPRAVLVIHPVNEEIPGLVASGKADVMITEVMEAAYYAAHDRRLAAPMPEAPFTRGKLGALLPPGSETLRDRVNDFLRDARQSGRLDELKAIHLHGKKQRALTILHLNGTWFEMGRQYGEAMKEPMRRVLRFAERRATEASDRYLLPHGLPCGVEFLDRFFAGVAAGSGLSTAELVRINGVEVAYGEDLHRFFGPESAGQCSALALFGVKSKGGVMLYGRNYDWLPTFAELGLVLTVFHPADTELRFAVLNYPGCFYLTTGMNSAGVFVELNSGMFASADTDAKALHNAWSLWHVLTRARNTDQAVGILRTLPARSAYIIGVADPEKSVSFEWGCGRSCALTAPDETGMLAMTNHFAQVGWRNLPGASGGKLSSISRRCAILRLAEEVPPHSADAETMKRLISVPVDSGGAMWQGTLYQVVAIPAQKEMLIRRRGRPDWVKFAF
ncbi:MAG: C45 family autoproteolytic acyltransferase/hydrolase [Lentisphaeria bacterium]|nr:C45 family autoproteolytic acyltransferase/hydrolase [Lentisphaeria bacterium]